MRQGGTKRPCHESEEQQSGVLTSGSTANVPTGTCATCHTKGLIKADLPNVKVFDVVLHTRDSLHLIYHMSSLIRADLPTVERARFNLTHLRFCQLNRDDGMIFVVMCIGDTFFSGCTDVSEDTNGASALAIASV